MPFLRDISNQFHAELSSYAACVLMVDLALRCFSHVQSDDGDTRNQGFWDCHFNLSKLVRERRLLMGPHLTNRAACEDPVALTTQLNMSAIEATLQETAAVKAQETGFSSEIGRAHV